MNRFVPSLLLGAILAFHLVPVAAPAQPPPQMPVIRGMAVATCFSGRNPANWMSIIDGYVVGIIDVHSPVPPLWNAPMYHGPANSWRAANLGQIFGIAIDKRNNIYVGATSAYGNFAADPLAFGPGGAGAIYRLDGGTGTISDAVGNPGNFVVTAPYTTTAAASVGTNAIPNGNSSVKPGLGDLCYSAKYDRLWATNMEDGTIYAINPLTGMIVDTYDPIAPASPGGTTNPAMVADNLTLGYAPAGDRLWGIGWNPSDDRLYYAVWVEDLGSGNLTLANVIRSVALTPTGAIIPGSDRLDIVIPHAPVLSGGGNSTGLSGPIADIAFASNGKMLLAERSMSGPSSNGAHSSRVLQYNGAFPAWGAPQQVYVGIYSQSQNAAGGVDYGYKSWDVQKRVNEGCDSILWMTGDYLTNVPAFGIAYGLQRTPRTGNTPGTVTTNGFFIDLNGVGGTQDKTLIGDVEINRELCEQVQTDPPCDSIIVRLKKDATYGDRACCWSVTVINASTGGYLFSQITATVITPGVTITNSTAPAGWTTSGTGLQSTWNAPAGGIPNGTTTGITFCLNIGLTAPPQQLVFSFVGEDGQVCTDTVTVDCVPPAPVPGCASLQKTELFCKTVNANSTSYGFNFQLSNESLFYVISGAQIVSVTPGSISVSPTSFTFPPSGIPTNGVSTTQSMTINGGQPGDTVCLRFELFNADMTWCCKFDTCFVLPPCEDCCDGKRITYSGQGLPTPALTHNGQGISTVSGILTVAPTPLIAMSATVVSAHIKRFGQSFCKPTANWLPVSGTIVTPAPSVNGLPLDPMAQPFPAPPPPAFGSATWGTVPAGVSFAAGVPFSLQLTFPAPPAPIAGCYDSIRFCVRYTFTDTNCVTCDTVICYQQRRVGTLIICCPGDVGNPIKLGSIRLATPNTGTLTVQLPPANPNGGPEDELRIIGIRLEPAPGVGMVSLDGTPARDNAVVLRTTIAQGEKRDFAAVFDNYASRTSFPLKLLVRYTRAGSPGDTMEVEETLIARIPGYNGGDSVGNDDVTPRPTGVRTFMLYFVNSNTDQAPISRLKIRVSASNRILAFGPPQDSSEVTIEAAGTEGEETVLAVAVPGLGGGAVKPGETVRPIYLTLASADTGRVTVRYTTYDANGVEVSNGEVDLSDPLSTNAVDNDPTNRTTTGSGVYLAPVQPNPGSGDRSMVFVLDRAGEVFLGIYNEAGEEVGRVVEGEWFSRGEHVVIHRDDLLPSGNYFVRLVTPHGTSVQPLQIVR